MRVKASWTSIARNGVFALGALSALGSVQCARIAGLGDGDGPPGDGSSTSSTVADGQVTVFPATLSFSDTACGGAATDKPLLTIHNGTAASVHYVVQIPAGAAFSVVGALEGDVAGSQNLMLPTVATPSLAGANVADLIVTAGPAAQPVHATVNGTGPAMAFDPPLVAFGEVRKEVGGAPMTVNVKNGGTAALVMPNKMIASNTAFVMSAGDPLTVAAGATGTIAVTLEASSMGEDATALVATMKPDVTGLCGAPPVLTLTGQRVTTSVTVTNGEWGAQSCGDTPGAMDLVISNFSNEEVDYAIGTAPPSFTVQDMGSSAGVGKLPLAVNDTSPSTATVRVTPKQLPTTAPLPDINETLHFDFTGAVMDSKDASLHVDVRGSIISYDPPSYKFPGDAALTFTVTNVGNENITSMVFGFQSQAGGSWSVDPHLLQIPLFLSANGGKGTGTVRLSSSMPSAAAIVNAGALSSGPVCGGGFATLPMTR